MTDGHRQRRFLGQIKTLFQILFEYANEALSYQVCANPDTHSVHESGLWINQSKLYSILWIKSGQKFLYMVFKMSHKILRLSADK